MFRKTIFKLAAAFLLMLATLGLSMPAHAYAQAGGTQAQSVYHSSGKCDKVKNKQKKKECEKQEKQGKSKDKDKGKGKDKDKGHDDGPNHDANDDHDNDGPGHN